MASHDLIDAYLAELARRLPAAVVDELADGLTETFQYHLDRGLAPAAAAAGAIAEFGTTDHVSAAFIHAAPGRRTARLLLASGPVVGMTWGACLLAARVWTWHIPALASVGFGLTLLGAVMLLAVAATGASYRRTRLAAAAGTVMVSLDATMICAVMLLASPHPEQAQRHAVAFHAEVISSTQLRRAVPGHRM